MRSSRNQATASQCRVIVSLIVRMRDSGRQGQFDVRSLPMLAAGLLTEHSAHMLPAPTIRRELLQCIPTRLTLRQMRRQQLFVSLSQLFAERLLKKVKVAVSRGHGKERFSICDFGFRRPDRVEQVPATLVPGLQPWNALPGGSSLLVHAFNTLARQEPRWQCVPRLEPRNEMRL